jgi:hypothetical protein
MHLYPIYIFQYLGTDCRQICTTYYVHQKIAV